MLPVTDLLLDGVARRNACTLVLLHFFGGSRRQWIECSLLLGSKFRVLSIDTPGFGDARDIAGYSVDEMTASFAETLERLKLDRFVLVGHSMTGKVAMALARQGMPGLEKLVLVTPSPPAPEPIPEDARAAMLAQSEPSPDDAERYVADNSSLPIDPAVFARTVEDRMRAHPAAWRAWLESGSREDWSTRVNTLELPALVIAAERDKTLGPDVQQRLTLPHLQNGKLTVVAGSGHLIPMEAPEKLAALVHEFACEKTTRSEALRWG